MKMNLLARARSLLRVKKADMRIAKAMASALTVLPFGPSSLNLMMVDSCNSQCIMCGKDYKACGTMQYISSNDIRTIYSHLDMDQIVDVIYGGGGEPFLNPDIAEIAAYTHARFPVIQHTVISNLIQWPQEKVAAMLDSRVHFLVSLNAASRETYKTISGVDAFQAVVSHIENLVRLRMDRKAPVHIALSMILMRQNIDELVNFIKLSSELGADEVKTLYVRVYPEDYRIKQDRDVFIAPSDSLFYEQQRSDDIIRKAESVAKEKGIRFEHEPYFSCSRQTERNCNEAWKSLFINFNGDVYPCPASEILFKPKVDSGEYASGNILQSHIDEIWNNPFWQKLRETNLRHSRKEHYPECRCCGNSINWWGSDAEKAHVLDWQEISPAVGKKS